MRLRGPIARDVIAGVTSLSIATVNRQVIALLEAGLLRERADLAISGAIGRPRRAGRGQPRAVPDAGHPHRRTNHQHRGHRPVRPHPRRRRDPDTAQRRRARRWPSLADSAGRYLRRWHRRRPLWVGVAIGGAVDGATGHVDHPRLGWRHAPVGPVLADALGLPVSVASHVDAMAGAELLLGMRRFAPTARRPACTSTPARRWAMRW